MKKKGFWKRFLEEPQLTYSVEVICLNCGSTDILRHRFGKILPKKKLDIHQCSKCGCRKVFRRNFVQTDDTDNVISANGALISGMVCAGR